MHLINIVIPMTWGYKYTDWKSVCRWFNSTSGHRLIISDISILSYIILVWFEELNKFYKVLQAEYWAINPQPSSTLVLQNSSTPTTPTGTPHHFVVLGVHYPTKIIISDISPQTLSSSFSRPSAKKVESYSLTQNTFPFKIGPFWTLWEHICILS